MIIYRFPQLANAILTIAVLGCSLGGVFADEAMGIKELRTWRSAAGSAIEARFISITPAGEVTLETKDRTIELPLSKLSEADQKLIKNRPIEPLRVLMVGQSNSRYGGEVLRDLLTKSPHSKSVVEVMSLQKNKPIHESPSLLEHLKTKNWDVVIVSIDSYEFISKPIRDALPETLGSIRKAAGSAKLYWLGCHAFDARAGSRELPGATDEYGGIVKAYDKINQRAAKLLGQENYIDTNAGIARLAKEGDNMWKNAYLPGGVHLDAYGRWVYAAMIYAEVFGGDPVALADQMKIKESNHFRPAADKKADLRTIAKIAKELGK